MGEKEGKIRQPRVSARIVFAADAGGGGTGLGFKQKQATLSPFTSSHASHLLASESSESNTGKPEVCCVL